MNIPAEQRQRLMRRCQIPRSMYELTHGRDDGKHIEAWLEQLVRDGWIELHAGTYITTSDGRELLHAEPGIAGARRHYSTECYVPPSRASVRAGADDFLRCRSVGVPT